MSNHLVDPNQPSGEFWGHLQQMFPYIYFQFRYLIILLRLLVQQQYNWTWVFENQKNFQEKKCPWRQIFLLFLIDVFYHLCVLFIIIDAPQNGEESDKSAFEDDNAIVPSASVLRGNAVVHNKPWMAMEAL